MRSLGCLLVGSLLLSTAGCGNKGQGRAFSRPTLVSVNPEHLEDAECGQQPGQMRAYVATLWDTTPYPTFREEDCELNCGLYDPLREEFADERFTSDECLQMLDGVTPTPAGYELYTQALCDWFELPSSGLVACNMPVGFSFVALGHHYMARVEGYERDDLVPLFAGSPVMKDPDSGVVVPPTWAWACTDSAAAVHNWDNPLVDCRLLTPSPANTVTSIQVDTSSLLGDLECGDAAERVGRLEVTLIGDEPFVQNIACDEDAVFSTLASGAPLITGASYSLEVAAYATGTNEPAWRSSCYADTIRGVSVAARCSPLSPIP